MARATFKAGGGKGKGNRKKPKETESVFFGYFRDLKSCKQAS